MEIKKHQAEMPPNLGAIITNVKGVNTKSGKKLNK
jgi:hypothetical protein